MHIIIEKVICLLSVSVYQFLLTPKFQTIGLQFKFNKRHVCWLYIVWVCFRGSVCINSIQSIHQTPPKSWLWLHLHVFRKSHVWQDINDADAILLFSLQKLPLLDYKCVCVSIQNSTWTLLQHTVCICICIIVQNHIRMLSVSAKNVDIHKYVFADTYPCTYGCDSLSQYLFTLNSKQQFISGPLCVSHHCSLQQFSQLLHWRRVS